MAFSAVPRTAAGATISISATLPASITQTAYAALTWALVGEVTNIGEIGRAWQVATHQALAKDYADKLKSTYDDGQVAIQAAYAPGDAGQVIVTAAVESKNGYSFKITQDDGEIRYFQALVLSAPVTTGASGDIIGCTINTDILNATTKTVAPA